MPGLLPLEKFCEEERSKFLVLEHENVKAAIREYYCANPACPFTDVLLEFIALDEQNNAVKRLFTIRLDTRTWEVKEKPRHADKIVEEFTSRLGKGLKNRFLVHLIKAKEYGGKHYLDYVSEEHAKKILSGSMFDYQEIYGPKNSEKFFFDFDGERYLLIDQYCLNPKCPCNEVALIFIKLDQRKDAPKPSFDIRLNVNSHKYRIEESDCKSDEMGAVIGHVLENEPILKLLKSRHREMRIAGKEILDKYGQKEPVAKVGRNDPCPCGSGKKA